jgi:hypothetical protein
MSMIFAFNDNVLTRYLQQCNKMNRQSKAGGFGCILIIILPNTILSFEI